MDKFHLMKQMKLFANVNKIDSNFILYLDTRTKSFAIMPESSINHL